MIRIISGRWRGKLLQTLPGQHTRPTADRTRQALFNVLEHNPEFLARSSGFLSVWQNLVVVDGFAGSGALGLEALSRGADQAYFFEQHSEAVNVIQQNINQLSAQTKSHLYPGNILNPPLLSTQSGLIPAHLVFLDPPYHQDLIIPSLQSLEKQGWLQPNCRFVLEMAADEELPIVPPYHWWQERLYGSTKVVLGWRLTR